MVDFNSPEYLVNFIMSFPGMDSFMESHKDVHDLFALLNEYEEELKVLGDIPADLRISISIAREKYASLIENSPQALHHLNYSLQVDDAEILKSFYNDIKTNKDAEYVFERAEKQRYKTYTEKIARRVVDYSHIVDKYLEIDHPGISWQISAAYINAKSWDVGLAYLQKTLSHVFSNLNYYWDNPFALSGCAEAVYEFQHLLGRQGMDCIAEEIPGGRYTILKCIYLYLSRAIYICDHEVSKTPRGAENIPPAIINKINYLSSRADIVYDYRQEFAAIFGFGVNPDIQYISDKMSAYGLAMEYGIEVICKDCFNDAMMMYRHGGFHPNDTGGYAEIEDDPLGDLIQRGQYRSEKYAHELYKEYKAGKFFVSRSGLAECIWFLKDKLQHSIDFAKDQKEERKKLKEQWFQEWLNKIAEVGRTSIEKFKDALCRLKPFAAYIRRKFAENRINYLYHFTDIENVQSIIDNGGLFSWKYCEENGINIPHEGGDEWSREKDMQYGLEDYVRLSFCDDHPMTYRLKCSGRRLVLLKIRPDVAYAQDTLFSDINAVAAHHHHGGDINSFNLIDLHAVKQHFVSRNSPFFEKHQAEVLVKTCIPLDYIVNIKEPQKI